MYLLTYLHIHTWLGSWWMCCRAVAAVKSHRVVSLASQRTHVHPRLFGKTRRFISCTSSVAVRWLSAVPPVLIVLLCYWCGYLLADILRCCSDVF